MKTLARFAIVLGAFGMVIACMTTGATPTAAPTAVPAATAAPATSLPPSPVAAATSSSTATAAPAVSGAGAKVPSSCDALVSVVGSYIGGVATTKSLGSPKQLSCELANADASKIVIINIGAGGTPAAFAALRAGTAKDGRVVTDISGLGVVAFSVSKNNVPAGVAALTAEGILYDVNSNLPIDQDEALIRQLMALG